MEVTFHHHHAVEIRHLRRDADPGLAKGRKAPRALARPAERQMRAERLVGPTEPRALQRLVHGARDRGDRLLPLGESDPENARLGEARERSERAEARRGGGEPLRGRSNHRARARDPRFAEVPQEPDRHVQVLRANPGDAGRPGGQVAGHGAQVLRPRRRNREGHERPDRHRADRSRRLRKSSA